MTINNTRKAYTWILVYMADKVRDEMGAAAKAVVDEARTQLPSVEGVDWTELTEMVRMQQRIHGED